MLLHKLLAELDPQLPLSGISNPEISGICDDSRLVKPGDLFVARSGPNTDGSQYVSEAIRRGAMAIVADHDAGEGRPGRITVPDAGLAVSKLAHIFHVYPSEKMHVLGVTGTNGKTTTTYLMRHILRRARQRCGLIGTVEIDDGKEVHEATLTTPGAVEIARLMRAMNDHGCAACAMETSSHALHQGRVNGVRFAAAAFTNLTGDHLDYHHTMEEYAGAKARLFEMLDESAVAVINSQDDWSGRMIRDCRARVVRFGFDSSAQYRAEKIELASHGSSFMLCTPRGRAPVELSMIGRHNIANALTAVALVAEKFQLPLELIAAALEDATGAPGRLQSVRAGQPFAVIVDYAHTDDALENVLAALRPITQGRLRLLFGCGGDRDRTKRPRMARAAAELADVVYVTSDNPRTENPSAIVDEIVAGFPPGKIKPLFVEVDRRKAIEKILADAQTGDVVLLAGKGHENYQIIGTTKHHFDDVEEAKKVLEHRLTT
jgi:UDP-N-acetylmuramoyl-L-alanyl-D-glutamate--2,6-diaminopimelate ligase